MSDQNVKTENTGIETGLRLTPSAVEEVKRLKGLEKEGENLMLRVAVQGGGCSGLSYVMAFDQDKADSDLTFDFDGLQVVVDDRSLKYLAGTVIDFSKEILSGGFKFDNPNSVRGCGCGTSFSV